MTRQLSSPRSAFEDSLLLTNEGNEHGAVLEIQLHAKLDHPRQSYN
jgi:hypothetical protein